MQGLSNLLRISKPTAQVGSEQSKSLVFSPLPGRLPEVVFHPVHVFHSHIGDEKLAIYQNLHSGTCWGFRRVIARSQSGQVFVAAALVQHPESKQYFYKHPYVLAAVKMESKARVQETQAKLSRGGHGDNSMLDRALVAHLATTTAAPHSIRLLECWHDRDHLYTVMDYLRDGDLLDCVAAQTVTRCLDEGAARRAMAGALACLDTLHTLGFMHRDISPENIMVDTEGRGVVIDFGSALPMQPHRHSAPHASPTQTPAGPGAVPPLAGWHAMPPPTAGSVFCKPQYACPWYVWARPWYGVSYDLYSIGTTLFAILEGRTLYGGPAPAADPAFRAILEADPAALAAWHMPGCMPVPGVEGSGKQAASDVSQSECSDLPGMPAPTPQLIMLLQRWNAARPSLGRMPVSAECLDLLGRLLRLTPACRPFTARDVLAHPWFAASLPASFANDGPLLMPNLMPQVNMDTGVGDTQEEPVKQAQAAASYPVSMSARSALPSMRGLAHPDGIELEEEGDMSPSTAMLAQGVRALGVSAGPGGGAGAIGAPVGGLAADHALGQTSTGGMDLS